MEKIIEGFKDIIVQIHTPGGSGSGFIVKDKKSDRYKSSRNSR